MCEHNIYTAWFLLSLQNVNAHGVVYETRQIDQNK